MELVLSALIGISLSATSGFRVFVPFLALSVANLFGVLELGQSFAWIGSWPALIIFAVATAVEILAYFIPFVDNALNAISVPASAVAGTVLTFSVLGEVSPELGWALAVVGGGGASLLTRSLSNVVHAGSTATTGGTANPILSFFESLGTLIMSILAIFAPILALLVLLFLIYGAVRVFNKFPHRRT